MISRIWLTVKEAADYASMSKDTIYTACERRELRHVRVGGRRTIRLRAEWIDAWLEQHSRPIDQTSPETTPGSGVSDRFSGR